MSSDRERDVSGALVALASSLVDGYDVVDLLIRLTDECARLLDLGPAGLLLADQRGVLHVVAASTESARQLELLQLQRADGPARDCLRTGRPVLVPDLQEQAERWPLFVPAARHQGLRSVHAVPVRMRDQVLGVLDLFGTGVGELDPADVLLAQAMADVASIALVQDRLLRDSSAVDVQLEAALAGRVVLEQAKGVLAQRGGLGMEQALAVLRRYARDHDLRLTEVATLVVSRRLPVEQVLGA